MFTISEKLKELIKQKTENIIPAPVPADGPMVMFCGCTGNCGQSCSGDCEGSCKGDCYSGCKGNCGRSCSGSNS